MAIPTREPQSKRRYEPMGGGGGGAAAGGGGSPLSVFEIDGAPNVANVTSIRVTNGTLTDNGGGQVTLTIGSVPTSPGGVDKQVQINSLGAFAGAAGFEYQSGAAPNVLINAQGGFAPLQVRQNLAAATPLAGGFPGLITTSIVNSAIYWMQVWTNDAAAKKWVSFLNNSSQYGIATEDFSAEYLFRPTSGLQITATGATADLMTLINSATVFSINSAGVITSTPNARTSGVSNYLTINAPADTGLTASTEAIGVRFVGATRQHATGAITTQREFVIEAPIYSFVGASTITTAITLAVTGQPVAGANAIITTPIALSVLGRSVFNTTTYTDPLGAGALSCLIIGTPSNGVLSRYFFGDFSATTPILSVTNGTISGFVGHLNGVTVTDGLIIGTFTAHPLIMRSNNTDRMTILSTGEVGVNKNTSHAGQLHIVSAATSRLAVQVESASGATVALSNLIHTSDQTVAVRTHTQNYSRSSGTAGNGFGGRILYGLETSTTNDIDAAFFDWLWVDATHASRKARCIFTVFDTAAREALRIEASGTAPMIGFLGANAVARTSAYTPTNVTTDRAYDANATTLDEVADVLGTLIADLQGFGLLG